MAKMGRPQADTSHFNTQVFEALCAVWATEEDVCAEFQLTPRTLRRAIREHYGARFGARCTFASVAAHFQNKTRLSVRRFYLSQALSRDAQGDAKHPAMLRHAVDRFGGLHPTRDVGDSARRRKQDARTDAAAELEAQQRLHGTAPTVPQPDTAPDLTTPAGLELERARRLADMLTRVIKGDAS